MYAHVEKLVYMHTNHCLLKRIKERGLCLMKIKLEMIDKEDDERLLMIKKQELIIDVGDSDAMSIARLGFLRTWAQSPFFNIVNTTP